VGNKRPTPKGLSWLTCPAAFLLDCAKWDPLPVVPATLIRPLGHRKHAAPVFIVSSTAGMRTLPLKPPTVPGAIRSALHCRQHREAFAVVLNLRSSNTLPLILHAQLNPMAIAYRRIMHQTTRFIRSLERLAKVTYH
jgi:hypothetical protein